MLCDDRLNARALPECCRATRQPVRHATGRRGDEPSSSIEIGHGCNTEETQRAPWPPPKGDGADDGDTIRKREKATADFADTRGSPEMKSEAPRHRVSREPKESDRKIRGKKLKPSNVVRHFSAHHFSVFPLCRFVNFVFAFRRQDLPVCQSTRRRSLLSANIRAIRGSSPAS